MIHYLLAFPVNTEAWCFSALHFSVKVLVYPSFLIAILYVEASRQAVYPKIEEGATF